MIDRKALLSTDIVHSCIRQQKDSPYKLINTQKLNMQIQYIQNTTDNTCMTNSFPSKTKIRSHSFYRNRPQSRILRNSKKSVIQKKTKQNQIQYRVSVPKRISVQFDVNNKKKIKQSNQKYDINQKLDFNVVVANSMKKYLNKIDRDKQKKMAKYAYGNLFGLDIKQIKYQQSKQLMEKVSRLRQKLIENNSTSLDLGVLSYQNKCKTDKSICLISTINHHHSIQQSNKKKYSLRNKQSKKQQQDTTVLARLNRMMNFLAVVLYSYGCYMNMKDISQYKNQKSNKYTYYVGGGNNKNLIISLLRKRWWWAQSQDINTANFVWTQLRVNSLSEKIVKMNTSTVNAAQPQKYINKQPKKSQNLNPVKKLFHNIFKSQFYCKISRQQQKSTFRQIKPPQILHNHYSSNFILGNKKALFFHLIQYCSYKQQDIYDIIPLTYHVQNIQSQSWKLFENYVNQHKKTLWIIKPGQNSNRGQGIFVSNSIYKIKAKIKQLQHKQTFIIQKYLKNIFLFNRRKFDIRMYLLMVTIGGSTKFYWYSQGYVRTSSQLYDLSDLTDPLIHLTNDAIQYHGDNYGKYEAGNKISFHQFQRYLKTNYPNQNFQMDSLVANMKQIAKKAVKATYNYIDPQHRQSGFQLFGLDYLVDGGFRPWLIQINTNPCLQLSSPCLQRLIPWMLENAFRIGLDPLFPPCCKCPRNLLCYIPDNLPQRNRFELLFDSLFDGDLNWQQSCPKQQQNNNYDDPNQQFEGDGNIITLEDIY